MSGNGENFRTQNGERIQLLSKLGAAGNEGQVWRSSVGSVVMAAKIYYEKRRDAQQSRKLSFMLGELTERIPHNDGQQGFSICWPKIKIIDDADRCAGFAMDAADGGALNRAYVPKLRKKYFPHPLAPVIIAHNIAAALESVHKLGLVVGDLKPANILLRHDCHIALIDIDSMHLVDLAREINFPCLNGTPGFCPREIIARSSGASEAADRFALTSILFLLFTSRRPFEGGENEEDNILHGRWALPPGQMLLDKSIEHFFRQCFTNGHADPAQRPSAAEWRGVLKAAVDRGLAVVQDNAIVERPAVPPLRPEPAAQPPRAMPQSKPAVAVTVPVTPQPRSFRGAALVSVLAVLLAAIWFRPRPTSDRPALPLATVPLVMVVPDKPALSTPVVPAKIKSEPPPKLAPAISTKALLDISKSVTAPTALDPTPVIKTIAPQQSYEQQIEKAFADLNQKNYRDAEDALLRIVAQKPDDPLARKAQQILDTLKQAAQSDSRYASALREGFAQLDEGRWADAEGSFSRTLQERPADAEARRGTTLVRDAVKAAQYASGENRYSQNIAAAEWATRQGMFTHAARSYNLALDARPGDNTAMRGLKSASENAARQEERFWSAMLRGKEAKAGGRWSEAVVAFQQALNLNPADKTAEAELSAARKAAGPVERAQDTTPIAPQIKIKLSGGRTIDAAAVEAAGNAYLVRNARGEYSVVFKRDVEAIDGLAEKVTSPHE